jgi:hypothetical protein
VMVRFSTQIVMPSGTQTSKPVMRNFFIDQELAAGHVPALPQGAHDALGLSLKSVA